MSKRKRNTIKTLKGTENWLNLGSSPNFTPNSKQIQAFFDDFRGNRS